MVTRRKISVENQDNNASDLLARAVVLRKLLFILDAPMTFNEQQKLERLRNISPIDIALGRYEHDDDQTVAEENPVLHVWGE
jgi:hypothetical protein